MDITQQLLKSHYNYSSSDNTNPDRYSSSKTLNYATGASISKAEIVQVNLVPATLKYLDTVGLFGTENHFVKINLNIIGNVVQKEYLEPGYIKGDVLFFSEENDADFVTSSIDQGGAENDPGYSSAATPSLTLPSIGSDAYLSVDLTNLKTSNIYNDANVDVRLYTNESEEHPYDLMYIKPSDYFYIGVHARTTRRLPYNIQIDIGNEYKSLESIDDKSYIMKGVDRPSY